MWECEIVTPWLLESDNPCNFWRSEKACVCFLGHAFEMNMPLSGWGPPVAQVFFRWIFPHLPSEIDPQKNKFLREHGTIQFVDITSIWMFITQTPNQSINQATNQSTNQSKMNLETCFTSSFTHLLSSKKKMLGGFWGANQLLRQTANR